METGFTRLVGCAAPLQLAGMPELVTDALALAVADAGGLAMIAAPLTPPERLAARLDDLRGRTPGALGVTFLMPFLDPGCVQAAAARARVVDFFYGTPDAALVATVHRGGALAAWQVGSREEAVAAEAAGVDFLIAQGVEAGGHVRGGIGLLPLLSQVLEAVRCPVLGAGGIATARDLAAVLAAGAAGARLGTRFLASAESGAHPRYVERLLAARSEDTVCTEAFSVMWPHAPHRVLASCIAAAEAAPEVVGETSLGGRRLPVPRLSVMAPTRETTGDLEAMALYAGQSVGAVRAILPAGEIVRELAAGAERLLAEAAGRAPEHPNAALVRRLFDAFRRQDVDAILAVVPEDVVWHFPGRHGRLAGTHRGRDAVLRFLAQVAELTGGTFHLALEDVTASDGHAVALFRGHGTRAGRTLDNPTALAIRLAGGRIVELREFVWDLAHVEAFWS